MRRRLLVVAAFLLGAPACGDDSPAHPDAPLVDAGPDAPTNTEVTCETLTPAASGTCDVVPGGATKLIKGEVLTPNTLFHGGQVAVDAAGQITCVGCDCAAGGETVITCADGAISPGLINTHDHITFTQNNPYTDSGVRYDDRQQWRKGLDGKPKISSSGGASADQIRWGEQRFLMGGATSIVGSGGQPGLLRNLDSANQEGLAKKAVEFDTFPLDDSSGTRRSTDCNYGGTPTTADSLAAFDAYEPHTSEGVDTTAHNEFLCQSSATYDTMAPGTSNTLTVAKTAMIHAIGLAPADYSAMAQAGTGLIWSPRSNITLYGDTARVAEAAKLGVEIALGTDWIPTGSMNMLRELACADSFNKTYLAGSFNDVSLWQMVTLNAASVTATDDVIGVLAPGKVADISIFTRHGKPGYRSVIEAEPKDVALVMRGGKVLYGDDTAVTALSSAACDAVDVCSVGKKVCLMGEVGKTYAALQTAVGAGMYPAFACGQPMNEPSCTPSRPAATAGSTVFTGATSATDMDGDGIENTADNCPTVFNPVRPMDNGMQGDADSDGAGDACDPCPLDPNTNTCTTGDPNDRDHDGVPNATDNCPDAANMDQADADTDGHGDVCDACPMAPNPGTAGCAATIYQIKSGVVPVGSSVHLTNALVTGKGTNGFFVQIKETDAGYTGPDNSGLFVFTGTAAPTLANATVGTRVAIDGSVANFQGQTELDPVTAVTVMAAGPEALPAPIATTYAEVATGGTKALAYEGVIVSLGASAVTATNAMFGELTVTQSGGASTLIVDDLLFVPTPAPVVGQSFSALKGILTLRQMASKLEPRTASDLTLGSPGIATFGPSVSYARVGVTTNAPTFPSALTITLTGPAQGATQVMVMSNSASLTVGSVTIPNGGTTATVPVTAVSANPDVTVTAMLGVQTITAHVRVLGATEAPSTVTLSPADTAVAPGGSVTFTVTLDVPALTTATVNLAVNPSNAGTLPASVTIGATQTTATFTYTDAASLGTATVTASLAGTASTSSATVTVNTGANHVVINEVDYDQIGTDNAEFVELYNPSAVAQSLAGKQLLLINGNNGLVYDTINLTGTLASHAYLVVAGANVSVGAGVTKLDPGWTTDRVQNGAPDGVALIDNTAHTLIDALSYEGGMTMIDLPGFTAPVSLVEGTMLAATVADSNTADGSLCRSPNGQDTDDAAGDWKLCAAPTAGQPNP